MISDYSKTGNKLYFLLVFCFLLGSTVTFLLLQKYDSEAKLLEQSQKLFVIDQKIISASDHAFVEVLSCYETLALCDMKKSNDYIGKIEKDRRQLLQEKRQIINQYPSLIPESAREVWGVK